MRMAAVEEAASLIAAARQNQQRIDVLPTACRPQSVAEAHAIQDAVASKLGAVVGAFKGTAPRPREKSRSQGEANASTSAAAPWLSTEGVRAPIFEKAIHASPCVFPSPQAPQCGVEAEIAFRFLRDLPPRDTPYGHEEVAAATDAYVAIEVVSSRFASPDNATFLDKLADCVSNGGFVHGSSKSDWQQLRFSELRVMLVVNGETVVDQVGSHPTGDPFAVVVAVVEMMRTTVGVRAGQFVTCGSWTGLRYFKPGDVCEARFEGIGTAKLTFST